MGTSFDKPGHSPAQRALDAMKHVIDDPDCPKGIAVGNHACFPNPKPENCQIPLRQAGYNIVGDYKTVELGGQQEFAGMVLINGDWASPSMPPSLPTVSVDYRAGEISEAEYFQRIEQGQK